MLWNSESIRRSVDPKGLKTPGRTKLNRTRSKVRQKTPKVPISHQQLRAATSIVPHEIQRISNPHLKLNLRVSPQSHEATERLETEASHWLYSETHPWTFVIESPTQRHRATLINESQQNRHWKLDWLNTGAWLTALTYRHLDEWDHQILNEQFYRQKGWKSSTLAPPLNLVSYQVDVPIRRRQIRGDDDG